MRRHFARYSRRHAARACLILRRAHRPVLSDARRAKSCSGSALRCSRSRATIPPFGLAVRDERRTKSARKQRSFAQDARHLRRYRRRRKMRLHPLPRGWEVARLGTFAPAGNGRNRIDATVSMTGDFSHQPADDGGIVERRLRVRHAGHCRETAANRGLRTSGDRLFLRESGLAQVDVHIDESGRDDGCAASRISSSPEASRRSPISAIAPARRRKSRSESREVAGSTILPPLINSPLIGR